MLQRLYRFLSIHSGGYVLKKIVAFKLLMGSLFIGLALYGVLANFILFLVVFSIFGFDYLFYRAFLNEKFYKVEEYAKQFNSSKLLNAEGAYRPITDQELDNPICSEETGYILESIQNECVEGLALEIGCGSGVLTVGALEKRMEIISTDFTIRSLIITGEVAKRHGCVANRVLADAQHLPFKTSCFNLVIASSVIEHLPDDIRGFKESERVLNHGGRIIFSFPSCHSPVFSLYSFFFNPIILLERLVSWKIPLILPKRSKFVYLSELFLSREKASFCDVSIHRQYDQKTIRNIFKNLGLSVKLNGFFSTRGGKLTTGQLQKLVEHHVYLAHTFIVFGGKI
jgi:ubiquinone/menaquinone biosynthesis C-methylase UbiE